MPQVGDVLTTVNAVETKRLTLDEVKGIILGPQVATFF